MKILVFLLLICVNSFQCGDIVPYSRIREIIDQFLNSLRDTLPEELPIPDREISGPENDYISSNVTIYRAAIGGLQYFNADVEYTGNLVPIPTRVTIEYDKLTYRSEFDSKVGIDIIPQDIYENHGTIQSLITNTVLVGAIDFSLTPLSLQLKDLSLELEATEVEVKGILGSKLLSRWTSAFLTKYGAQIVNDSADVLIPRITEVINNFLQISFPRSSTIEKQDVDYSRYTKEELDAKADDLKNRLDGIIQQLKAISNIN